MLSSGVCGENSINDKPTYGLGWQASRLDAVSNMDLAGSDHSSCGQTYSSFCRQRPLLPRTHLLLLLPVKITPRILLRPYLLFLLPEETIPLAAAPLLVAAGRDYSSCHPHANEVGSEMSGGGSKAGGGGRAKRTDNVPFYY